jgi:hypothetical protein
VINGNVDCKERCGLDRIHSLERSKDGRKGVDYRFNLSYNFWLVFLTNSLIISLCLSQDFLCRPTRTFYNLYILHGRVAHRNQFPNCQFELFFGCGKDEEQTALKWDRSCYPFATPGGHFLLFLPEIINPLNA